MPAPPSQDLTQLLLAWRDGDETALDRLMPIVYDELRRLARRYVGREEPGHRLQTGDIVHEAYVRLIDASQVPWQNRAHFYAVMARMMRRILIDFARKRRNLKRGGGAEQITLACIDLAAPEAPPDLVKLDEALMELALLDPRQSLVVELRFFGGLSLEETAEVLEVSVATVRRDWSLAKAWLRRELSS